MRSSVSRKPDSPAWQGLQHYLAVRAHTLALAAPLSAEDQCIQSMPDASPTKWHLAHTTWFFETLVLQAQAPGYRPFDPRYAYLFNSYYEALGPRHPRPQRGLLTRPTLEDVLAYRTHVDEAMQTLLHDTDATRWSRLAPILTLGLQHEQQHQELLLTDILHALSCNPLLPAYQPGLPAGRSPSKDGLGEGHQAEGAARRPGRAPALRLLGGEATDERAGTAGWLEHPGGVVEIGADPASGAFAFDNETPRHPVLLRPYAIADRLVTCGDYARFIADGGYERAELWLSDGWAAVQREGWRCPPYWLEADDPRLRGHVEDAQHAWYVYGLQGVEPMRADAPVSQLSFYEAAAYAAWAGARLPTEFEWEAACGLPGIQDMTGQVWQWTRSSYDPYPGFAPLGGIASEYNGKFMVGQLVLRGGSVATAPGHARPTYRNFFPPSARWQFSGLRLARDR